MTSTLSNILSQVNIDVRIYMYIHVQSIFGKLKIISDEMIHTCSTSFEKQMLKHTQCVVVLMRVKVCGYTSMALRTTNASYSRGVMSSANTTSSK